MSTPAPSRHHLSDKATRLISVYAARNIGWTSDPAGMIGHLNESHDALSNYVAYLERENRLYAEQAEDHERKANTSFEKLTAAEDRIAFLEGALTGPKVEFYQQDFIPGFAAFLPDATTPAPDSKAFCVLNLGSLLAGVQLGDVPASDVPYAVAECIMHEVMHALEQWAEVEFSEDRIEALLERYRERFRVGDSAVPGDATEPFTPDQIGGLRDAAFHMDGVASLARAADYVGALYDLAADLAYPPRPVINFFNSLTPEQKAAALAYDGPENFGPDECRLDAPPHLRVVGSLEVIEEDGYGIASAVASIYATAKKVMAEAGPMPLTGTEPWAEDDEPYRRRLMPAVGSRLPIVWEKADLDFVGDQVDLPRACLVLVEG